MKAAKKLALTALIPGSLLLFSIPVFSGDAVLIPIPCAPETLWLQPDAPTFDTTIPVMREQFNRNNPALPLREYKVVASNDITASYLRAATQISPYIYSSAVLERDSEKIKSLQLTLLPAADSSQSKANRTRMLAYIKALIIQFEPTLNNNNIDTALSRALATDFQAGTYASQFGALRYLLVVDSEKGVTFAIEPIKLSLSNSKAGQ
ncbi:DUF1454 family protein [Morganella psychrotolerans]|uniref:DUF1454 family protein n=1 Tax=Morganella psychrotolerans TaxID=368603 RepID=A0A1B8HRF6_9GAMM|nr:DUF1454 family protein [Morganella psychrotolerans]OBU11862.1 hypothetical protein AYY18_18020 [Morganella psychrotolerans]